MKLVTLAWNEGGSVRSLKCEIEYEDENLIVALTLKKRITLYKKGNIIKKEEYLEDEYDNAYEDKKAKTQ